MGETVLLPTYHQTITRARLTTPDRSSRGSSTAFRPALQGQRLRLGGPPDAPVAPLSLRSFVRPRQCARRPAMSLGPGVRTARAQMKL